MVVVVVVVVILRLQFFSSKADIVLWNLCLSRHAIWKSNEFLPSLMPTRVFTTSCLLLRAMLILAPAFTFIFNYVIMLTLFFLHIFLIR